MSSLEDRHMDINESLARQSIEKTKSDILVQEKHAEEQVRRSRAETNLTKEIRRQELKQAAEIHKLNMRLIRLKLRQEKANLHLNEEILYQKTLESAIHEIQLEDAREQLEFHRGMRLLKTQEEEEEKKKPN